MAQGIARQCLRAQIDGVVQRRADAGNDSFKRGLQRGHVRGKWRDLSDFVGEFMSDEARRVLRLE